jgi:small GTP-binding protein
MKDRSLSGSRASERHLGFLRRVRHYSTSSNKSSDFDSLDDETVSVSSLRRRSSSGKQSKRNLTKNISNSSCDSEVFVENNKTFRVMFLGASSVGKTSIITQFLKNQFSSKHQETLQDMYNGELDLGGSSLLLSIEDTGSSFIQDFPAMAEVSLKNSDGVVLVFSVDDPKSFEDVSKLRDFIFSKQPSLPCVIVGNKTDLERNLPAREIEATVCLDWECGYADSALQSAVPGRGQGSGGSSWSWRCRLRSL